MFVVDWQIIGLLNAFTPQKSFEEFQDVYVALSSSPAVLTLVISSSSSRNSFSYY